MKNFITITIVSLILFITNSCMNKEKCSQCSNEPTLEEKIKGYSPALIKADLSRFNDKQKLLIKKLVEAGHLADKIFWQQTSPDAVAVRDSLMKLNTPEAKSLLKYVMINYGAYDLIYEKKRFVGQGLEKKPAVANYYPIDMTKEEFEKYVKEHPDQKETLESQYTVVRRDGKMLKAIPFHEAYPEVIQLAKLLDEASELADNPALKKYLHLRAEAVKTDNYFESDMAWMDMTDSDIDVVIGPIENYQDALFNYKTAYETVVMVKDIAATKDLDMFKAHIDDFEKNLPSKKEYIRSSAGGLSSQLNIVDVVYFGGDCQAGSKTIAASLPNDPKVHELKGGKKNMYKNLMDAKFDKIVVPIGQKIMDLSLVKYIDKKSFTSFVTLHEVSHTLGRGFVFGNDALSVRKALKEKFSSIEEAKADILSMYNHKYLLEKGLLNQEEIKKAMVTYVAGLYRSVRFGAEEAHGKANLIQLNFLREKGAIIRDKDGKFSINEKIFFDKVSELAALLLNTEAEGDYTGAGKIIKKYGIMNSEINMVIESLKDLPRDLDTSYEL